MQLVRLESETDFDGWRAAARRLRLAKVAPDHVIWSVGGLDITDPEPEAKSDAAFSVPREFIELAENVILHRSPERFALLYRLLWRLADQPRLLEISTDPDVASALDMRKAVSRASHKMKAFVRFRLAEGVEPETYVAWFEPAHRVVEKTAPHFVRRFANMRFSILTPDACAHWDGRELSFTPGADASQAPREDALEEFWRTYYASIFNPARLKTAAMQREMPKRYWRNLPEAVLIPSLIGQAEARSAAMIATGPSVPRKKTAAGAAARVLHEAPPEPSETPGSLAEIARSIQVCRRCDLWRDAIHTAKEDRRRDRRAHGARGPARTR
jgi:DNA polymerase